MQIWDVHRHLSGVPGNSPEERLVTEISTDSVWFGTLVFKLVGH